MHPILFQFVHPITGLPVMVTTYAALMFLGAALGIALACWLATREGLPAFDLFAAGAIAFGTGFLGARLGYLLLNGLGGGELNLRDLESLRSWFGSGGLVWYGGLIGGSLGALIYLRAYKLPLLKTLDVAAPGLALGHAVGRLGCLSAGCCYGRPALDLPWAIQFPPGSLAPPYLPLHPTQLYEAAGLLLLCLLLLVLNLKRTVGSRPGAVMGIYLGLYALLRLWVERYRFDDRGAIAGAHSPSSIIAVVVLLSLGLTWVLRRRKQRATGP